MTLRTPRVYEEAAGDVRNTPIPALVWPSLTTSDAGRTLCTGGSAPDRHLYVWQDRARRLRGIDDALPGNGSDPRLDLALQPFMDALIDAQDRVYVLDIHAFDLALPVIAEAMSVTSASDIRVLSKRDAAPRTLWLAGSGGARSRKTVGLAGAVAAMQDERDQGLTERRPGLVRWQFLNGADQEMVHDRFALVDDDLWHWGASVGGLHRGIHAVSHGWSDAAPGFRDLFLDLWKGGGQVL